MPLGEMGKTVGETGLEGKSKFQVIILCLRCLLNIQEEISKRELNV